MTYFIILSWTDVQWNIYFLLSVLLDVKWIGRFVCNVSVPLTDDFHRVSHKTVHTTLYCNVVLENVGIVV
jgi:hypothetical protein